jgi:hypothetical protein
MFIRESTVHRKKLMILSLSRSIIETFKTFIGKACCDDSTVLRRYSLGVSELMS